MSFDSLIYLIFLPSVYSVYLLLGHRLQNLWLLAASYLFYGWWDVRFLFLIVVSTAVDYCCGLLIERDSLKPAQYMRSAFAVTLALPLFLFIPELIDQSGSSSIGMSPLVAVSAAVLIIAFIAGPTGYFGLRRLSRERRRKIVLLTSIASNLGILGFFKYFNFFVSSAEALVRSVGISNVEVMHLNVVLPVGISFYTFQTLSYSIGVYRGETKATSDFTGFSLFVAFFPQLVAGPIERASSLLPIILHSRRITRAHVTNGLYLILLGMFKKVGISNGVSASVDSIYNSTASVSSLDVAMATFFFAVQIYCDFSGYSDIARGSAKLFGFDLMRNFEQPYFSSNPSEFWRRWHISLSTWLRDYLYISLGGNRDSSSKTYRNLMLTMLLGGLWHGAAWNFVLWGGFQGTILCIHRYLTRSGSRLPRLKNPAWRAVFVPGFFVVTCYGWLLFRADSMDQILSFTHTLTLGFDYSLSSLSMKTPTFSALLGLVVLAIVDSASYRADDPYFHQRLSAFSRAVLYSSLLFVVVMGMSNEPSQFIYFQF